VDFDPRPGPCREDYVKRWERSKKLELRGKTLKNKFCAPRRGIEVENGTGLFARGPKNEEEVEGSGAGSRVKVRILMGRPGRTRALSGLKRGRRNVGAGKLEMCGRKNDPVAWRRSQATERVRGGKHRGGFWSLKQTKWSKTAGAGESFSERATDPAYQATETIPNKSQRKECQKERA